MYDGFGIAPYTFFNLLMCAALVYDFGQTKFELSDSMAEELINLAIIMSTEIVESSRLTTKANTRPLES